jgi:hypothetical protein
MRVYVFVEGAADRQALEVLWQGWRERLRAVGWGVAVIPLDDKSRVLRKIGHRAAEKLVASQQDLVVGLPDLYPIAQYRGTEYGHENLCQLQEIQKGRVTDALRSIYGKSAGDMDGLMRRFLPSALKHDLEMLLLAARNELRAYLRTPDHLGSWRHPVEDQNQQQPPKHIVEELFRTQRGWHYRDTIHAPAVMRKVTDIRVLLFDKQGQLQCPVFKETLDWIGKCTGVPTY